MAKLFAYEVKDEFFELVCGGFPFEAAERVIGVARGTGTAWWRRSGVMDLTPQTGATGGLPGSVPAMVPGATGPDEPPRKRRPLTSEDRAVIAAGLRCERSPADIARLIGRDRSVVSREIARNTSLDGSYWGSVAHRAAHEKRRRPKSFKLAQNPELCRQIEQWMDQGWSPKLIASMLALEHPPGSMGRVSHETIYQALYVQTRGQLRADLHRQLSLKRATRKPRGGKRHGGSTPYAEAFKISQRPAEVADRAVPGHWEGDLILGPGNASAIGTLVERTTRFTILLHLPGRHDADSVAQAMIQEMSKLPEHLRRSITWDRGSELAGYRNVQVQLGTTLYFCDPHSPWQRGSNENTNRLLRFWFEKGTDLSVHTAEDLQRVADTLNKRPRPTLNLKTPAQVLGELLNQAA